MRGLISDRSRIVAVLSSSIRLGLTSFGGPIAHLGYFRDEYVVRRRWLEERDYVSIVALCQLLPGPASSQVLMAIGMQRAGLVGGLAAWLGFTLPSAVCLVLFAFGLEVLDIVDSGWIQGLKIVAVAVVANAILGMARTMANGPRRGTVALVSTIIMVAVGTPIVQVLIIIGAGIFGVLFLVPDDVTHRPDINNRLASRFKLGVASWFVFALLLVALPIAAHSSTSQVLRVFDSFYRVGSLVFGGGHVVLPLIEAEVVSQGWITTDRFIAGYGAVQAVPGPLFSFAAYLGAASTGTITGVTGATLALVAIYVPSFLLLVGTLPFWHAINQRASIRASISGINAAVVGLLSAALYDPIWAEAIVETHDFALGLVAFGLLMVWRVPPWIVVLLTAAGGQLLSVA